MEGVFNKSKDMERKIRVTANEIRISIKINSKVIVGGFVAEPFSFEKGRESQ